MANGGEPSVQSPNVVPAWLKKLWNAHPLVVVAGVAVVALALSVALIWPITDLIAAHDVGLITGSTRPPALQAAREAVRTQLLTLGAGVFAAGALIFTARNFTLSRRTVELTRQTFKLTEQGQVTDRYTKAIEQLGSEKLDVRIGSIYALERVARDSARDYPTAIEVLAAFIREHSHERWPKGEPDSDAPPRRIRPRPDVQAAVTVIGRRITRNDSERIDLTGAVISRRDSHRRDSQRRRPHRRAPRPWISHRRRPHRRDSHRRDSHRRRPHRRESYWRAPRPRDSHRRESYQRTPHRRDPLRRGPQRRDPLRRGPHRRAAHRRRPPPRDISRRSASSRRMG